MRSQTLDKALILARIACVQRKVDIDVFISGDGYVHQMSVMRMNKQCKLKLSYEKGKCIIRGKDGRIKKGAALDKILFSEAKK